MCKITLQKFDKVSKIVFDNMHTYIHNYMITDAYKFYKFIHLHINMLLKVFLSIQG